MPKTQPPFAPNRLLVIKPSSLGDIVHGLQVIQMVARRLPECRIEPSLASAEPGSRFQFERQGYFCVDPDSRPGAPVFNRTVTLKDTWAKIAGRT